MSGGNYCDRRHRLDDLGNLGRHPESQAMKKRLAIQVAIMRDLFFPVDLVKVAGTYHYLIPADYPEDEPHPLDDRNQDSQSTVIAHPVSWWVDQLRERL